MADQDPGSGKFLPGNFSALRDGSRSPRAVAARSQRVGRRLRRQLRERDRQALIDLAVRVAAQEELMWERLQQQSGRGTASQDRHVRYASLEAALFARLGVGERTEVDDMLAAMQAQQDLQRRYASEPKP